MGTVKQITIKNRTYYFYNDIIDFVNFDSKEWSVDNMKRIGFTGYIYDFSVDYTSITINDIKDIPKYLMDKNNII